MRLAAAGQIAVPYQLGITIYGSPRCLARALLSEHERVNRVATRRPGCWRPCTRTTCHPAPQSLPAPQPAYRFPVPRAARHVPRHVSYTHAHAHVPSR